MDREDVQLVVDYGSLTTAALLAGPDGRWAPLTLDGGEVLTSAVLVKPDGSVLAGNQAWRADLNGGGGFVADPLRLGREQAIVAGVEIAVADLTSATLRLVAEAATDGGGTVGDVRLVVPVGWGPRRRTWLRQAANRAGLREASVVDAPVAAADLLTAAGQLPTRVGHYVLVVDLGAGCAATMLRRTPAGFETISAHDDPDTGGRTLEDRLLTQLLATQAALPGPPPAAAMASLTGGVDRVALASVRAAVEALSSVPAVTVTMPQPHPPMVLTAASVEITARPVWTRAGDLALEAIAAADLEPAQVSAVICIGGAANSPAAVQAIGYAVGQKPLVPDDPGRAALWGAAGATPATNDQVDASDGSWAAARAVARHVPALVVAGVASLAMFAQFVLQADPQNGTPFNHDQHYWVQATWGQLAIAAVCAMIACLSTGLVGAAFLADEKRVPLDGPRVAAGLAGGAAGGFGIAGAYAVLGSFLLGLPPGGVPALVGPAAAAHPRGARGDRAGRAPPYRTDRRVDALAAVLRPVHRVRRCRHGPAAVLEQRHPLAGPGRLPDPRRPHGRAVDGHRPDPRPGVPAAVPDHHRCPADPVLFRDRGLARRRHHRRHVRGHSRGLARRPHLDPGPPDDANTTGPCPLSRIRIPAASPVTDAARVSIAPL